MVAPISPRKRALMPSGKLRRLLRAHGHQLNPVVQIGKDGLSAGVLAQIREALLVHELIKVKLGTECPEDRFDVAERLAGEGILVAQVLGRVVLLYQRHPERPKFERGRGDLSSGEAGEE